MSTQVTISVDWIAHELSLRIPAVIEWADRLHLEHSRDESGRRWIPHADGRQIFDEIRKAGREAAELHEAYERYLEVWEQKRKQVGDDVYQRVLLAEHQRQLSTETPENYAFVGDRWSEGG